MGLPVALLVALLPAHPAPAIPSETERMLRAPESFAVLARSFDPEDWVPRSMAAEMRLQYEDLVREYEARAAFQVVSREETLRQLESRRAFARYVVLRLGTRKAAQEFRRVDRRNGGRVAQARRAYSGIVRGARKPVEFAAALPGVQYGSSVNLLELNGRLWAHSALVNASITVQGARPPLPQILRRDLEVFVSTERWQADVWRPVPLLRDTEARVTYGASSSTLGFSVVQRTTENLRTVYEITSVEQALKVQYAVRI